MIRLPLNRANELVQIEKVRKERGGAGRGDSEVVEIARQLDMDKDHVADLINISRDLISLDTPIYDEKDSSLLSDFVEDRGYKAPHEVVVDKALREEINLVLETLSRKEADIIQYRFGLNGRRPTNDRITNEQFRQDVAIWEHKAWLAKPRLTPVDGPVLRYREWFAQFYPRAEGA